MKNRKLNLLLLLFLLCLSSNVFAGGKNKSDSVTIHFKPGTFEVSEKDINSLLKKLNKSKKYKIEGYSCGKDKDSDVERLAEASRGAEAIGKILAEHGLPAKNITTVAYDNSLECKAIVIESD